jgi:hypothetical protein
MAAPLFIDESLSENHTAVQASGLTFFEDEPEKGANFHPKRSSVNPLLKKVIAENRGHLTLEKGATCQAF